MGITFYGFSRLMVALDAFPLLDLDSLGQVLRGLALALWSGAVMWLLQVARRTNFQGAVVMSEAVERSLGTAEG
jgi:hypothetical protein